MLASQLIYTGCGKDRTGAFAVWSKTLDISKAEENEIRDKMLYKRPTNLPFEPTPEELETLFPKKFGYFYLSTGKACLAQSVYIGNVYSDRDKRTGNYIIHAFVFDSIDGLTPINFIDSPLFRRELTYQEWHEQDAPDELPKVEIEDQQNNLTKQDLDAFFDADKYEKLKLLLQAIINASGNDQKISFYDKHQNLKYWYKAIGLCLPKSMQKGLTFNTFFTPTMSLPNQAQAGAGAVNTEVKIRNIAPTVASTLFNYAQDARAGKYAFDLESGILPAGLAAGEFVQAVVETLKSNLFNAIMLVDAVSKVSDRCKVDLDMGLKIHYLLSKRLEMFRDIPVLEQVLGYVTASYREAVPEVANCLYTQGLAAGKWPITSSISNIYRMVLEHSTVADKNKMVHLYVANQPAFGVNVGLGHKEYAASFRSNAPFAWNAFLTYILKPENLTAYKAACGSSFNSRYLIFDAFVDVLPKVTEDQDAKQTVMRYFVDEAKHYIKKEMMNEVQALMACIERCGSKWRTWLMKNAYTVLQREHKRISDVCSVEFTFSMIESCCDVETAFEYVGQLIMENEHSEGFLKRFAARAAQNPACYNGIMERLRKVAKYEPFLRSMEFYKFELETRVTRSMLQDYYDRYVITGKDSGLFAKKLRQYLNAYSQQNAIEEAIASFNAWVKHAHVNVSAELSVIGDTVFSVAPEHLKAYIGARGIVEIRDLILELSDRHYSIPAHYYVIAFGENMKRAIGEIRTDKNSPKAKSILDKLDDGSFYQIPKEPTARALLIKMYLREMVELYFALADKNNFELIYHQLFQPLYAGADFDRCFVEIVSKLNERFYERMLSDTIICACCREGDFNRYLKKLAESMLDSLGRGQKKKLLADVLETVPQKYAKETEAYVQQLQKKNQGFFEKLFGGKEKKESDKKSDSAREEKRSDREDKRSDREDRRSDREDRRSDREDRRSDRDDRRSDREEKRDRKWKK